MNKKYFVFTATKFSTPKKKLSSLISSMLAASIIASPTTQAADVKLHIQAPFDYSTGAFDLDDIENYNQSPVYKHSFIIPYTQLQQIATNALKQNVDQVINGTEECPTVLCPDVSYRVTVTSEFDFTQTGQPVIQSFGNADENGFNVSLEGVQARIKLNISVHTNLTPEDVQVPIEVIVGAHGHASAKLWPVLQVAEPKAMLTLDGKNIEINGLDGNAIQIGAELGAVVGFSPAGFLVGGPVIGTLVGIFGGDAAADEAEKQIKKIISNKLDVAITIANATLETQLEQYLTPTVAQANAFKDQLLNKPLLGIGKSLTALQNDWGMNLDVRSDVKDNTLTTVATTRFSSAQNGGRLFGRIRLPKKQCDYLEIDRPDTGHVVKAIGLKEGVNSDLAEKVGQDCNSVLAIQELNAAVYLGESPESQLNSGKPENIFPRWENAGLLSFSGNLVDKNQYYECAFSVNALPAMAITELSTSAVLKNKVSNNMTDSDPTSERVVHIPVGLDSVQFNSEIEPYDTDGIILGNRGPQSIDECKRKGSGSGGVQEPFDPVKPDPETCPQCRPDLGPDKFKDVINPATNSNTLIEQGSIKISNPVQNVGDAVSLNPQPLPPKINGQSVFNQAGKQKQLFSQ
jgi:hypothetical protein